LACAAKAPFGLFVTSPLDRKKHHTCGQVGKDDRPTDRGDAQEIAEHAMPAAEQPGVARKNSEDSRQAEDDEP